MAKRTKNSRSNKLHAMNKKGFGARNTKTFSSINKNAKSSDKVDRKTPGEEGFYRTKATIKRLKMYKEKKILSTDRPKDPARIESNRKYFGNTRSIDTKKLDKLRKEFEEREKSNKISNIGSKQALLKQHKIPLSLLYNNTSTNTGINKLIEPFDKTFGPNNTRKKPKFTNISNLEELAADTEKKLDGYNLEKDSEQLKIIAHEENEKKPCISKFMTAGQSRRIYSELHKVIDSSDVLCQILDARDPEGTRSSYVENFIKHNCNHKHIVIVLNKCDLVPTWVTAKWIQFYSKLFPTIAFHASINNPFGKPALFQILKQFDTIHKDKKHISVGFIGYPNVGKSSVINTLKKQACCKSAPIPGETRVWQYVSLTKRIYLIDCPGVVYDMGEDETDKVLKSVLRVEKIQDPLEHINGIIKKTKRENLEKIYGVDGWSNAEEFITKLAVKFGKLGRGAEPDFKSTSKIVLMDWQRGKIPFYIVPEGFDKNIDNSGKMEIDEENVNKNCNIDNYNNTEEDKNNEFNIVQDLNEIKEEKFDI